ncbi:hypothetical protein TRVL_07157 [Trypanosoma vivax]|nr:hypothetical protein TRVL_07157 [Trypanosoma vivax]
MPICPLSRCWVAPWFSLRFPDCPVRTPNFLSTFLLRRPSVPRYDSQTLRLRRSRLATNCARKCKSALSVLDSRATPPSSPVSPFDKCVCPSLPLALPASLCIAPPPQVPLSACSPCRRRPLFHKCLWASFTPLVETSGVIYTTGPACGALGRCLSPSRTHFHFISRISPHRSISFLSCAPRACTFHHRFTLCAKTCAQQFLCCSAIGWRNSVHRCSRMSWVSYFERSSAPMRVHLSIASLVLLRPFNTRPS